MDYTPPTTEDLQRLKARLGLNGKQMAALAGVAGDQQWRKYTGGAEPRAMSAPMAFFMAAKLSLSPDEMQRVLDAAEALGAHIRLTDEDYLPAEPRSKGN